MLNILLVEDEQDLATTLIHFFELNSISCDHASNGVRALELIRNNFYHLVVLDINLPLLDGISACQLMRKEGIDTPVLMLTACDSLADKIQGFESGADDYLVKPFELAELKARVHALSKRRSGLSQILHVADLKLDCKLKKAWRGEEQLKLSPTTFKLLEVLMKHSPTPVSKEQLTHLVWGEDSPESDSLKVHIHHLRKHIDRNAPPLIHTVRGVGVVVCEEAEL